MKSLLCLSALVVCGVTGLDLSLISGVASAAVVANAKAVPTSTFADGSDASPASELLIPGPLRSFLRMAGISQQISPDDVFPFWPGTYPRWAIKAAIIPQNT